MKHTTNILNIISSLIGIFSDYSNIKRDETLRPKSKMFGVRSIILSCIGIVLITIFGNLTLRVLGALNNPDLAFLVYLLFLIVLIIIDIYLLGYFLIYPLICWILQISLNKKAIGWIAMVVWIVLLVVSTGSFFLVKNAF